MKKLILLILCLPLFALCGAEQLWPELSALFPHRFELGAGQDAIESLYGKAQLVKDDTHYYRYREINYPISFKFKEKKLVGGSFTMLSPYPKVMTLSSLLPRLKNWTKRTPTETHDFGRYVFYHSPDSSFELRFSLNGNDGVLDSFSWGESK